MPAGMYAAHAPSQPRSEAAGTTRRSNAGPGSTVSRKPMLSTARLTNSNAGAVASAPAALAEPISNRPSTITRRGPKRSAIDPPAMPNSAAPNMNNETIQLA